MSIRIVTDSACDLPDELVERHGIEVVPLNIRFGDEEYVDRFELDVASFYDKLAHHESLPETSAPAPGRFAEAFQRQADAGADTVICVNISSALSATMESAQQAAKSVDVDVRVVDSLSVSGAIGLACVEAAEAAEEGRSADDIVAMLEERAPRTHIYGALNTLENLKKGGRIGGAQALLGNMLAIKPILAIDNGKVEEASKQRTRKKALAWLRDRALADDVEDLMVLNGMAPDFDEFLDTLAPKYGRDDLYLATIGPVIGTHAGPGVIGIGFRTKP
ncbi:MAG: DegV family protein [Acidimicrobiales bacterium]|nr:DegV family protein [Acidimicrobiales bacterium]MCB9372357.1 DegV family protein [Microthrixaceae bacterium]